MISETLYTRVIPDGRIIAVIRLTFGRARLTIGRDIWTYNDGW